MTGTVTVTDLAGNTVTFTSPTVKIDKTASTGTMVINGGRGGHEHRGRYAHAQLHRHPVRPDADALLDRRDDLVGVRPLRHDCSLHTADRRRDEDGLRAGRRRGRKREPGLRHDRAHHHHGRAAADRGDRCHGRPDVRRLRSADLPVHGHDFRHDRVAGGHARREGDRQRRDDRHLLSECGRAPDRCHGDRRRGQDRDDQGQLRGTRRSRGSSARCIARSSSASSPRSRSSR